MISIVWNRNIISSIRYLSEKIPRINDTKSLIEKLIVKSLGLRNKKIDNIVLPKDR